MSQRGPRMFLLLCLLLGGHALAQSPTPKAAPPKPSAVDESLAKLRKAGKGPLADQLLAAIQSARKQREAHGLGHVLVGRVKLGGGPGKLEQLNSQVSLVGEGWFVTLVENLRNPVPLRLHGYDAVDISTQGLPAEELLSVGEVTLRPLPPEKLGAVRGRVVATDPKAPIQAYAYITAGDLNTPSGTINEDRPAVRLDIKQDKDGVFQLSGLTPRPARYELWFKAPDHVAQSRVVLAAAGTTQNLGEVRLEKPRQLRVRYVLSTTPPPFVDQPVQEAVVDGGQPFKADPQMQGATFVLQQRPGIQRLRFQTQPARLGQLGKGKLEEFRFVDPNTVQFVSPFEVGFDPSRVYLLDHRAVGQWVLFQVEPVTGEAK
ncbi:hypothetical protein [Hyalangium rubrum]|uniref:Carboxypeptidase regulatory-like domain-containing protein n=1 Tax=Hyalangium rubrum TaxID=3103134 RepID=A0ABU5H325_9BACT|nr:hypothetical protein [Hyalangium sp. s54d21]MDY7226480.1 hypothetical protein [Hyalangium sp. s54d21]